jgi:hypothetical protein
VREIAEGARPRVRENRNDVWFSSWQANDAEWRRIEQVTGRYFANSKPKTSSKRSYDEAAAARLWQLSADLVGLTTAG